MYYQVTDYYDPVGQKKIGSQCPDCKQRDCLELFFYQKRIESPFSKKVSKKVTGILFCDHTQTEISPVLWTDEIANYFETEKKKLRLNPTSFKLTKWFYLIISIPLLGIAAFMGYYTWEHQQYIDQTSRIENISVGDKVSTMMSELRNNELVASYNTWLLVKKIESDTVWLQYHRDRSESTNPDFNLDPSSFSGEVIKASLPQIKKRSVMGFDYTNMKFSGYITELKD
ncbi:hypothetical protein FGM00_04130 [Aggregatimonas sangjinii]|uniref:Uncharacterized protein n=1 Tax=Aggregatimonas sangjinii TaxID=2583587 RepID=A0A5B7SPM5_9FLAO|nr:hypothetical protein [Aggregatimonas sangjinii]QCW99338.1 hypothetical protein FGM00_04130 [Aggregatimonas sangjinii]